MKHSPILPAAILAGLVAAHTQAELAFPGAYGFGQNATGGRGGTIVYVTNTNDSGSGSFRSAVGTPNSIVLFSVGGTITLASAVSCADNLTIAGQTAPGGGIAIIGHEVSFSLKTNEIVRHLRFRPGSIAASTEDGINMGDGTNMIFDHISVEFAPYNSIDAHGNDTCGNNITIQNSILADPIGQQFNAHTEATGNNFSWYGNIFNCGHDRNPMAKVNTIFVNNVVNNFQAGYTVADTSGVFSHDIVNNYFIMGPATTSAGDDFYQFDANQSVYATGNLEDTAKSGVLTGNTVSPSGTTVLSSPWSSLTTAMPTLATASAVRRDVSVSGALPHDQVDTLVQADVLSFGTSGMGGGLWTSQTSTGLGNDGYGVINGGPAPALDADGLPTYWEIAMGLSTNVNNANTTGADGYTHVEEYINWLAGPNAFTTNGTPVAVNLSQYADGFSSPVYSVSGAVDGSVSLNGDVATFTANTGFSGMGSFNFTVTDTSGDSMTETVTVLVSPATTTGSTVLPVSVNFVGTGASLTTAQSAGVVAETNWNNAVGTNVSNQALHDLSGTANGAKLTWSGNHLSSENITNTAANYVMMNGYLNTATNTTTTLSVTGLPSHANGYKVYVYGEENTAGATRVAAYQISGTGITTTTIDATDPNTFAGTFTQANNSTGNYVVFTLGNVSGFTLTATPVSASDTNLRAPVNGLQIIPQ